MKTKTVHVELDDKGLPVRIFRNKDWRNYPDDQIVVLTKADAVGMIRQRVFERARHKLDHAECEKCGRTITWDTMEMNERIPKGSGGEVSLVNCEALCHDCHQGHADSAHGNRRWQTSRIKSEGHYDN